MTAPLSPDVDWAAVLTAGVAAVYGVHVQVLHAPPLRWSPWGSVECHDDRHDERLWLAPTQAVAR